MNFKSISKRLLDLDLGIISVEIANADGGILATQQRTKTQNVPNLSAEEAELLIMQSILRMNMRKTAESLYGKVHHSFTEYEKIKRLVVAWYSESLGRGEDIIVLLSIEKDAEHEPIISKVLKHLDNNSEIPKNQNHH